MNNRKKGTEKEEVAEEFLRKSGMRILERNFRCRQGEIDIIGFHNGYLTFIEVKYRKNENLGLPEEAVHREKQKKICNVARVYLYMHGCNAQQPVRFDVVAICGDEINWYQDAFPYCIGY